MSRVLGNTLKFGVILSALTIAAGELLFLVRDYNAPASTFLDYSMSDMQHGNYAFNLSTLGAGLASLDPFSVIELGLLILLLTPIARVCLSILLFHFQRDKYFVWITSGVFGILLFGLLVVPFLR